MASTVSDAQMKWVEKSDLPSRTKRIISRRYMGMTLEDAGKADGLSKERTRQIIVLALRKQP